jgi:hypothetical protein
MPADSNNNDNDNGRRIIQETQRLNDLKSELEQQLK